MSERMTSVRLRSKKCPRLEFADRGLSERASMIEKMRKEAQIVKEQCEAVLAAADSDFIVETYTGIFARHGIREVKS